MYDIRRHVLPLLAFLTVAAAPRPARAWVETSIQSAMTTVEVASEGKAVVRHELMVSVKGGPMKGLSLDGVDPDAEPLPDAQVVSVAEGRQGTPLPLLLHRSDAGTLSVEIDSEQGVRRGTFLFLFSYRTDLRGRGLIQRQNSSAIVRWIGPRFDEGIAEAKVVFRLPTSDVAPSVPEVDASGSDGALGEGLGGLFTTGIRRAGTHDELELARAHISRGEPVVWRAAVGPSAFPFLSTAEEPHALSVPSLQGAPARRSPERLGWLVGAGVAALLFAVLVALKGQLVRRMAVQRGASSRPLFSLSLAARAAVGGAALGAAVLLAGLTLRGTLAGFCILLAGLMAVERAPSLAVFARGPGRWLPMLDDDAWRARRPRLVGSWLDAGRPQGLLVMSLIAVIGSVVCWRLAASDLVRSAELATALLVLLPLFVTGRAGQLPLPLAEAPQGLFAWLAPRLRRDAALRVAGLGRFPLGSQQPDELRLVVTPRAALDGLYSLEVAVELQEGPAGRIAQPRLLVRVKDGSPAQRAFPRSVLWMRGRRPEERVAILSPKLPTRGLLLLLLRRVSATLSVSVQPPVSSARRSAGSCSVTAKPAMVAVPAHAS
jgi:hypothetical protein